jgi:hypothetical protein
VIAFLSPEVKALITDLLLLFSAGGVAGGVVAKALHWFVIRELKDFKKVPERLSSIEETLHYVTRKEGPLSQLERNGGESMRDLINTMASRQGIHTERD